MIIPKAVEKIASPLTERFNCGVKFMGKYEGGEAYIADLPDDATIGFPEVYFYKDGKATVIGAPTSFDIIDSFVEDTNVLGIE